MKTVKSIGTTDIGPVDVISINRGNVTMSFGPINTKSYKLLQTWTVGSKLHMMFMCIESGMHSAYLYTVQFTDGISSNGFICISQDPNHMVSDIKSIVEMPKDVEISFMNIIRCLIFNFGELGLVKLETMIRQELPINDKLKLISFSNMLEYLDLRSSTSLNIEDVIGEINNHLSIKPVIGT